MEIHDFKTEIIEKNYLTNDIIKLSVKSKDGFSFKAGQYLLIECCRGEEKDFKAYSILNPPSQKEKLDFCIKIVDKGFASEFFDKTGVGNLLRVKGPFGQFVFDEYSANKKHWFIGVGVGITPLYSMLRQHLPRKKDEDFRLIFGARTKESLVFHEEFLDLEQRYDNFTYTPTITRERDGKDETARYKNTSGQA